MEIEVCDTILILKNQQATSTTAISWKSEHPRMGFTKQICLVKKQTYRARVIEKLLRIPGKKRKNVAFLGFCFLVENGKIR